MIFDGSLSRLDCYRWRKLARIRNIVNTLLGTMSKIVVCKWFAIGRKGMQTDYKRRHDDDTRGDKEA